MCIGCHYIFKLVNGKKYHDCFLPFIYTIIICCVVDLCTAFVLKCRSVSVIGIFGFFKLLILLSKSTTLTLLALTLTIGSILSDGGLGLGLGLATA